MTDRELLELAAKAAGLQPVCFASNGCLVVKHAGGGSESCISFAWNPLSDDGDALRLAVKLNLGTDSTLSRVWAFQCGGGISAEEPRGIDGASATRRAITRAAAAIGQQMREGKA